MESKFTQLQQLLDDLKVNMKDDGLNPVSDTKKDLKAVEEKLLGRFRVSENFLVNQMEEQNVALAFLTLAFMMMCFYVFYHIIAQTIHLKRCRCIEHFSEWSTVVNASKLVLLQKTPPAQSEENKAPA